MVTEITDFKQLHMSAVCDGECATVEAYNDPIHTVESLLYKLKKRFDIPREYFLIIHPATLRELQFNTEPSSFTYQLMKMGIKVKRSSTISEGSVLLLHPRAVLLNGDIIHPEGVGYAKLES